MLIEVASFLGKEQQEVGLDLTAEDLLSSFMVEFNNKRESVGSDELLQYFLLQFTFEVSTAFIKLQN
jgi:hypothetical protein